MKTEYLSTKPAYVNAYSVERCYGGPEEGGWWYDAGEPIATIVVADENDEVGIKTAKERLTKEHGWKSNSQGRYSVNGGADFEISVEEVPAEAYPKSRPHYE